MKKLLQKKALTLMELVVAVIVLGVIVSTTLVSYADRKKRSEYDGAVAIVQLIAATEKNFFITTGAYQGTSSTADTNLRLDLRIVDDAFKNYRVSTATAPFVVLVDNGDCTYTFDSEGVRTGTNGGSDCLP